MIRRRHITLYCYLIADDYVSASPPPPFSIAAAMLAASYATPLFSLFSPPFRWLPLSAFQRHYFAFSATHFRRFSPVSFTLMIFDTAPAFDA